jgi:membrane fusion protein, heavy metal efflux system
MIAKNVRVAGTLLVSLALAGCQSETSGAAAEPEAEAVGRGEGVVELTPEQGVNAKIATGKVERRQQAGALSATAQIQPPANGVARVGPRLAGRVTAIRAELGEPVTKGKVLAIMDSPEIGRAKGDYLSALAISNVTRETADREKVLAEKKISSERDWRQAEAEATKARAEKEAAESRLHTMGISDAELGKLKAEGHYVSTLPVTSPIAGIVVERSVTLGQMLEPSDTLFVVMDLRQVWVLMDIYEEDLSQVRMGQEAVARVAAFPERTFNGKVDNIGAVVEPTTRAVKVRVVLPNPNGELKPGMFATVEVAGTTGERIAGLFVPAAAVQRDGDRTIVFVPKGERQYQRRAVKLGRSTGDWAQVLEGVTEGQTVVTNGSFILKAELKKGELGGEE